MNYIIFEDNNVKNLYPFTINHASFEIRVSHLTNFDRIKQSVKANDSIQIIVRPELEELVKMRYPDYDVNPNIISPGIFLNGAIVWDEHSILDYSNSDNLLKLTKQQYLKEVNFLDNYILEAQSYYISFLWDAIRIQNSLLDSDYKKYCQNNKQIEFDHVKFINAENIWIEDSVKVSPGVVLDASEGSIVVSENTIIDSNVVIKGPVFISEGCYIACQTVLNKNVSLGPVNKVGGELTNTIFHGYSNKVHYGFLGHSYIGEWVNLGAGTTNSNLKNNYSNVKFQFQNRTVESNEQFLGFLIGDYSRTSIGTLLNSGTYIGMAANIFNSRFNQKFYSSLSWGNDDSTNIQKLLSTITSMKNRRNQTLSNQEKDFLLKNNISDKI